MAAFLSIYAQYAVAVFNAESAATAAADAIKAADDAAKVERTCAEKIGKSYTSRYSIIINANEIRLALREAVDKTKYETQGKVKNRAGYLYTRLLKTLYPG